MTHLDITRARTFDLFLDGDGPPMLVGGIRGRVAHEIEEALQTTHPDARIVDVSDVAIAGFATSEPEHAPSDTVAA